MTNRVEASSPMGEHQKKQQFNKKNESENDFLNQFNTQLDQDLSLEQMINFFMSSSLKGHLNEISEDNSKPYKSIVKNIIDKL